MNWRLGKHATNTPVQTENVVDHDTLIPLQAFSDALCIREPFLKASTSRVRGRSRATSLLLLEEFRWNDVNQ